MSYTNGLDKPTDYFNTKLYTGNGSTQSITGVGFQPDLLWIRNRLNSGRTARAIDSVRGVGKLLNIAGTADEDTQADTVTSFDSDGFSLGADSSEYGVNDDTGSHVAWSWKAGTSFTNDASVTGIGSIDSSGSVSDASGFSIVSYTGTGSAGTIKHGLSAAPNFMIVKNRDAARSWNVYFGDSTDYMYLNDTAAAADYNEIWNDTTPTTSVFSVGTDNGVNQSGEKYIAYIFADVKGYSKVGGSYTGNGNADGPFIYTGFAPSFVMVKASSTTGNWTMFDNKRSPFNFVDNHLYANTSAAEQTASAGYIDFLSNGFKKTDTFNNASGETYIYMAFAEHPFVTSTGIPTTAR